jgi:uncharacterized protein (TIGR02996 family)
MSASEHAGFMSAIAANPADLTTRLIYADYLEETGEPQHTARAEFIRAQIESESLHANTTRRAELQKRASELFARHWVDWWKPVCEAAGLPLPHVPGTRLRDRVARLFGSNEPPGSPYSKLHLRVVGPYTRIAPPFTPVEYVRGFPEWVRVGGDISVMGTRLDRWASVVPLVGLECDLLDHQSWEAIEGPHLESVRRLGLHHVQTSRYLGLHYVDNTFDFISICRSSYFSQIEEVGLNITGRPEGVRNLLTDFVASPLADHIRQLTVSVNTGQELDALAAGPGLGSLTDLHISFRTGPPGYGQPLELVSPRGERVLLERHLFEQFVTGHPNLFMALAHSYFLSNVTGLSLTDTRFDTALDVLANSPMGRGLTRLAITGQVCNAQTIAVLARPGAFPALVDLSLKDTDGDQPPWGVLASSRVIRRIRHLRVTLAKKVDYQIEREGFEKLLAALDPERVETLRFGPPKAFPQACVQRATQRFGARVSFR